MPLWNKWLDQLPEEDRYILMQRTPSWHLKITFLYQIARSIADKHKLRMPAYKSIYDHCYKPRISETIITGNGNGILWVDREYIAYQIGTGEIQYVYYTWSGHFELYKLFGGKLDRETKAVIKAVVSSFQNIRSPIWISDEIQFNWTGGRTKYRAYAVHSMDYDWRKAIPEQRRRLAEYGFAAQNDGADTSGDAGSAAQPVSAERPRDTHE